MTLLTKLVIGQHLGKQRHQRIEHKLDSIRAMTTDLMARIVYLEEKYAGQSVGSTVVPESTPEREEMQQRAEKITGRYQAPKPPKKTS
jgi:hypothetical protein